MRRLLKLLVVSTIIFACTPTYANWYQDIINAINAQGKTSNGWLYSINSQQTSLLRSQQGVESMMRELNRSLMGNSGWGTYQFHDYQSYGMGTDWASLIRMAQSSQTNSGLGQNFNEINNQFPIDEYAYSRGSTNRENQRYYALKSQAVVAARATSQLDYDKIQDQISYQQMLQQQIEKTKDLKAATDLSNRIQVEGNLINLQILRQLTLLNQTQAITEQATVNSALANAKFLTKK